MSLFGGSFVLGLRFGLFEWWKVFAYGNERGM
jgi:hypothetical protein